MKLLPARIMDRFLQKQGRFGCLALLLLCVTGCHGWVMTEQSGGDTPEGFKDKDLADLLGKILASLPSHITQAEDRC